MLGNLIIWNYSKPHFMKKNYITPFGLQKLRDEYEALFHKERPKLVETIAWAASNGDRSENADYIYGKRRLREIDKRLSILQAKLEAVEVVDPKSVKGTKIVFGARVTLKDEDGFNSIFTIVGEDEIDVENGFISWKSPMAGSLLGKGLGDEITLVRPAGERFFTVEEVSFQWEERKKDVEK
jgi:transcription elongation factor GreB